MSDPLILRSGMRVKTLSGTVLRAEDEDDEAPQWINVHFTLAFLKQLADRVSAYPLNCCEMLALLKLAESIHIGNRATLTYTELCAAMPQYSSGAVAHAVCKLKRLGYLEPSRGIYRVNKQLFWRGKISDWQKAMSASLDPPTPEAEPPPLPHQPPYPP